MTALLQISGGLALAILLVATVSPYAARLLAWMLIAWANAFEAAWSTFRRDLPAELDRLHGPVVGE